MNYLVFLCLFGFLCCLVADTEYDILVASAMTRKWIGFHPQPLPERITVVHQETPYRSISEMWKALSDSSTRQWHECNWLSSVLDHTLPMNMTEEIFRKYGVIQLRPILNRRELLVGGSEEFLTLDDGKVFRSGIPGNPVTINPDAMGNPAIIGFFGCQDMPMIGNGSVDKIVFDNYFPTESRIVLNTISEIRRVLSPAGKVWFRGAITGDTQLDLSRLEWVAQRSEYVSLFGVARTLWALTIMLQGF